MTCKNWGIWDKSDELDSWMGICIAIGIGILHFDIGIGIGIGVGIPIRLTRMAQYEATQAGQSK